MIKNDFIRQCLRYSFLGVFVFLLSFSCIGYVRAEKVYTITESQLTELESNNEKLWKIIETSDEQLKQAQSSMKKQEKKLEVQYELLKVSERKLQEQEQLLKETEQSIGKLEKAKDRLVWQRNISLLALLGYIAFKR